MMDFHIIISEYLANRNMVTMEVNKDTDRLCLMLLSLIMPFYNKCFDDISFEEFEKKCEDIEGLSILHDYFVEIKRGKRLKYLMFHMLEMF